MTGRLFFQVQQEAIVESCAARQMPPLSAELCSQLQILSPTKQLSHIFLSDRYLQPSYPPAPNPFLFFMVDVKYRKTQGNEEQIS